MKGGRAIFVSGTDTGVGKTLFCIFSALYLRKKGVRVGVFKPVETGFSERGSDSAILKAASGCELPIDVICPYRFRSPEAPLSAGWKEGMRIDVRVLKRFVNELKRSYQFVIVEGAGGISTPYTSRATAVDIAKRLSLPVILVASERLGTISQTISALRAIQMAGWRCEGIVLNETGDGLGAPHRDSNYHLIKKFCSPIPILARIPFMKGFGDFRGSDIVDWGEGKIATFEASFFRGCLDRFLKLK